MKYSEYLRLVRSLVGIHHIYICIILKYAPQLRHYPKYNKKLKATINRRIKKVAGNDKHIILFPHPPDIEVNIANRKKYLSSLIAIYERKGQ